jgi:hypothetical protein
MKKIYANLLVAFFVLLILSASSQAGKNLRQPGDVAGALGALTGFLLLLIGLCYSARWSIKLSGHTYKLGRQTVAALLFWYSVIAAIFGLITLLMVRNAVGLQAGGVMFLIWSVAADACKRWQKRLWVAERVHSTEGSTEPVT